MGKLQFPIISLLLLLLWGIGVAATPGTAAQTGIHNADRLPAFPGAEGGGMYTTGGRGGKVLYVTKLDDDGSEGTLRWAVTQKYPRTILFKVSGLIELQKRLLITHGDVTIAGQSAPGDGICISNFGVQVRADNVIIRFLRFRTGDLMGEKAGDEDALGGRYFRNIIVDHCSMSWSTDECVSFYANENFTLQWCILTESLRKSLHDKGSHGFGGIWGGKNASFHHNLLSNHDSRNPRFDHPLVYVPNVEIDDFRGVTDFRNNVVYNWGNNSAYGGEGGKFNMVNNYYKPGPATAGVRTTYFLNAYGSAKDREGVMHDFGYPVLYMAGNVMEANKAISDDNYSAIKYAATGGSPGKLLESPLPVNALEEGHTTTQTAKDAFDLVVKYAGAFPRDTVDMRAAYDAATGKASVKDGGNGSRNGFVDTQSAVGGWPQYRSQAAPLDSDGDGIPDEWEEAHGLDKNDPGDANLTTLSSGGYTNLEVYLNSLVERIVSSQNDPGSLRETKDATGKKKPKTKK